MDIANGKTILNIEHNQELWSDDRLTINFTDGTKLIVTSVLCNDGGSALDIDFINQTPSK